MSISGSKECALLCSKVNTPHISSSSCDKTERHLKILLVSNPKTELHSYQDIVSTEVSIVF